MGLKGARGGKHHTHSLHRLFRVVRIELVTRGRFGSLDRIELLRLLDKIYFETYPKTRCCNDTHTTFKNALDHNHTRTQICRIHADFVFAPIVQRGCIYIDLNHGNMYCIYCWRLFLDRSVTVRI